MSTLTTGATPGAVTHVAVDSLPVGQKAMALSTPVVIASDQSTLPVSVASLPLPTGAATEATLGTRLADATFTARIPTEGQKAMVGSIPVVIASDQSGLPVTGTFWQATQPISAASLPLPTGAATEATLATRFADATFTARINTQGQKAMSASTPVVIASDQSAISVAQSGTWTVAVSGNPADNIAQWGGAATSLGSKSSASSVPVVVASDQGAIPVSQSGTWTVGLSSAGSNNFVGKVTAYSADSGGGDFKAFAAVGDTLQMAVSTRDWGGASVICYGTFSGFMFVFEVSEDAVLGSWTQVQALNETTGNVESIAAPKDNTPTIWWLPLGGHQKARIRCIGFSSGSPQTYMLGVSLGRGNATVGQGTTPWLGQTTLVRTTPTMPMDDDIIAVRQFAERAAVMYPPAFVEGRMGYMPASRLGFIDSPSRLGALAF